MSGGRLVCWKKKEAAALSLLFLPIVSEAVLFRFFVAAAAVHGTGVERSLKLSKLIVAQNDVGSSQVLQDALKIL